MKIDYRTYLNKVHGGWIGKCAGGLIGAKQENNKSLMNYTFDNVFPDMIPPNDDFDLQILYLTELIEKLGFNFGVQEIGKAFAEWNQCWANEYRVAIKNINVGVYPPFSGEFSNEFFKNSMGCPIRSELWAFIAPGNPEFAEKLVRLDGSVDHTTESIYAEIFLATVECMAFFEDDLNRLFDIGLTRIPEDCRIAECIRFIRAQVQETDDYRIIRQRLIRRFGSSDASYSVVNIGIIVLALLHGKDFNDVMLTAVNCGYDTDCTSATAGAILGILQGKSNLPKEWLEKVGDVFVIGTVNVQRKENTLTALTKDTFAACYAAARDGLIDLEFENVPKDFRCSIPSYRPSIEVMVAYDGEPSVSANRHASVIVTLCNQTDAAVKGRLKLEPPAQLSLDSSDLAVELAPHGTSKVQFTVSVREGTERLPVKNVIMARLQAGELGKEFEIGLYGASKYKLIGPFFDNYDTEKYEHDIYGECMQRDLNGNLDIFPMFNGFVSVRNEYLDINKTDECEGIYFYSGCDILPVEKNVTYQGPCCVYLVRDVYSAEEQTVHMFCGNSAPYRVWLNGELVSFNDEYLHWMPLNNVAEVRLRKGKNRLVFKLIRKNGVFCFSTSFSKLMYGNGVLVELDNEV